MVPFLKVVPDLQIEAVVAVVSDVSPAWVIRVIRIDSDDTGGMRNRALHLIVVIVALCPVIGCSSLGLSLQSGAPLTKSTQQVLDGARGFNQLPHELSTGVLPNHVLEPGDALLIEPHEFDTDIRLPADQRVMADGRIDLGAFGRASVAGLTLEDAEVLIGEKIVAAGHRQTGVNVRLLEPVHRFYILGAVNSPGSFPLVGHETVLDGIVSAGGLSSSAAPCKILLARPTPSSSCRIALPVCYHEITQLGDTTTNYQLRPGDRVFVASRSWVDELRFWESHHGCPRCESCQCPCPDPVAVGYPSGSSLMGADLSELGQPVPTPFDPSAAGDPLSAGPSNSPVMNLPAPQLPSTPKALPAPAVPNAKSSLTPPPVQPEGVPGRLPKTETLDGELDFEPPKKQDSASNRFEPLWVTPVRTGLTRP